MTKEEFEAFLKALDPDRERTGEKYEQIRSKLMTFFRGRGVTHSEDAVDEIVDRVARRVLAGEVQGVLPFIWGIARKVSSEIQKKRKDLPLDEAREPLVNPVDIASRKGRLLPRNLRL